MTNPPSTKPAAPVSDRKLATKLVGEILYDDPALILHFIERAFATIRADQKERDAGIAEARLALLIVLDGSIAHSRHKEAKLIAAAIRKGTDNG